MEEWVRWSVGTLIVATLAVFGGLRWLLNHISVGDRRSHERIDKLTLDIQRRIDELRNEAKLDRHKLSNDTMLLTKELHEDNLIFRDKLYQELSDIKESIGELKGIINHNEGIVGR